MEQLLSFNEQLKSILSEDEEDYGPLDTGKRELVTIQGKTFSKPIRTRAQEEKLRRLHSAGIIKAPGRKSINNHRKAKIRINDKDKIILEFLTVARLITVKQSKMITDNNLSEQNAYKRLVRLEKAGYLNKIQTWERGKSFYILGSKGKKWLLDNYSSEARIKLFKEKDILNINLNHHVAMSQWLAMFICGMTGNGLPENLRVVNNVLHENTIKSIYDFSSKAFDSKYTNNAFYKNVSKQITSAKSNWDPELYPGMFFTVGEKPKDGVFMPDFVINFESMRKRFESPVSFAVEIELSKKGLAELDKKLLSYEKNPHFKNVLYYFTSDAVRKSVERSIARTGVKKVLLFDLLGDDGKKITGDVWRL